MVTALFASDSFEGLSSPEIKRIAAGNPKTVPAGRYADEVFNHYEFINKILGKYHEFEKSLFCLRYVHRPLSHYGRD